MSLKQRTPRYPTSPTGFKPGDHIVYAPDGEKTGVRGRRRAVILSKPFIGMVDAEGNPVIVYRISLVGKMVPLIHAKSSDIEESENYWRDKEPRWGRE